MDLESRVLALCFASLLLKVIADGDRAETVGKEHGPKILGRSAEGSPRMIEQVLGEKS